MNRRRFTSRLAILLAALLNLIACGGEGGELGSDSQVDSQPAELEAFAVRELTLDPVCTPRVLPSPCDPEDLACQRRPVCRGLPRAQALERSWVASLIVDTIRADPYASSWRARAESSPPSTLVHEIRIEASERGVNRGRFEATVHSRGHLRLVGMDQPSTWIDQTKTIVGGYDGELNFIGASAATAEIRWGKSYVQIGQIWIAGCNDWVSFELECGMEFTCWGVSGETVPCTDVVFHAVP